MKSPCVNGRCPVSRDARAGVHTGTPDTAWVKFTHSRSNRSRCGVLTFGSPAKPNAWARHWSAMMKTMLGLLECSLAGAEVAAHALPTVARKSAARTRRDRPERGRGSMAQVG